jgi:hypothetical protein
MKRAVGGERPRDKPHPPETPPKKKDDAEKQGRERERRKRKRRLWKENTNTEKYAPPTLPKAVASKLWVVLNMHPQALSDVQPFVPPMPMPPMYPPDPASKIVSDVAPETAEKIKEKRWRRPD